MSPRITNRVSSYGWPSWSMLVCHTSITGTPGRRCSSRVSSGWGIRVLRPRLTGCCTPSSRRRSRTDLIAPQPLPHRRARPGGVRRAGRSSRSPSSSSLADTVPVRYRTLILLATFADMRWGELVGLRRENIDLDTCEIRITETSPSSTRAASARHAQVAGWPPHRGVPGRDRPGDPLASGTVRRAGAAGVRLRRAEGRSCSAARTSTAPGTRPERSVGLPDLHFHDLRHTGGTLTATTGATLKELMARLGHSSVRAALIYQHATQRPGPGHRQGPRRVRARSPRSRQGAGRQAERGEEGA